jgi:capsule polysaccharide export protein KpsE/RkpR
LAVVVKHKVFFAVLFALALGVGYVSVYYLIDERYEAAIRILPSDDNTSGGISSLIGGAIGDLPLGLGGMLGGGGGNNLLLFETIVYSRSTLVHLIEKFDLRDDYKKKTMQETIEAFRDDVDAGTDDDITFYVVITAYDPEKSAAIANYLVEYLNDRVIEINTQKSRENREYVERRLGLLRGRITEVEDSLRFYMEKSGVYEAESQVKATMEVIAELEAELATRRAELKAYERVAGKNTPQTQALRAGVEEIEKEIVNIKRGGRGKGSDVLLSLPTLPRNTVQYFRYLKEVEIQNALLEFMLPMYEQAKYNEQKDIPVVQVIDRASIPEKKSYPPRTLFSAIFASVVLLSAYLVVFIRESDALGNTEKGRYIRDNLFKFRSEDPPATRNDDR